MTKAHLRYRDQTPRERTWTIHFISLLKFAKGLVLVAAGIKLLTLLGSDVEAWATDFVTRHGIDLANRYVHSALERLAGVEDKQIMQLSGVAFGYSCLLFTEGIGLWRQKRWAEYLTAIATGLLIPFEIYEIYEKFAWIRIAILALNIFVVWYLVTRIKDETTESSNEASPTSAPRVKICGITNLGDARSAIELGADELGFNFYRKSVRYINPTAAAEITSSLPTGVVKVGVFVNESADKICEIAESVGLDKIQLHGDETDSFAEELAERCGRKVIKAFRLSAQTNKDEIIACDSAFILLDSYSATERGGTGEECDWGTAGAIASSKQADTVYLAGGLSAGNVSEAIRQVQPYAVDACSRLEPGKKDRVKMAEFIAEVKGAR
jgi:phosphoribosylanthranilate isomerase